MTARNTVTANEIRPEDLEHHRRELTGYCYRMLGSAFDADDAVQETMMRAWRGLDGLSGPASLRSWMYRIATNVSLDLLRGRQRRARPMDMGPASTADSAIGPALPENMWLQPIPDARVLPPGGDPAELAAEKETIRLSFVAALQYLPPRQRAVLILREVLCWQAAEVAELLDTSVASVNSALQRARATLSAHDVAASQPRTVTADQQALLAKYVDAFERYDVSLLVTLLRDDAIMSMPPLALWLRGPAEIAKWFLGKGIGCRGSRLVPAAANGCAAFGSYRPDGHGGHRPWALQVIEVCGDQIAGYHSFVVGLPECPDNRLFAAFGLPAALAP